MPGVELAVQSQREDTSMSACEICGNEDKKPLKIYYRGVVHTFDGLECAVHALATTCVRCGCKFIKRAGASVAAACDPCARGVYASE
jgi:hypothetical protein